MDKFEEWFASQNFYANMRFIHGEGLFIKDGEVYRVLPVQMSWKSWQSRQSEFDAITEAILNQTQLLAKKQAEVDQLKEAIERQGKLAIQAMNEAHKGSRLELSIAKDIQASLKPELIESERQMNAELTDENMRLEARIEAACESINSFFDNQVSTPTPREYANFIAEILEALRGEHE